MNNLLVSRFPRCSLASSAELASRLLGKVSLAGATTAEAAAALDYTGISGATKTAFVALKQYGLIEKNHGKDLVLPSKDLVQLQTVKSPEEQRSICQRLALKPLLFRRMHEERLNPDDLALVTRWLLLQKLTATEAAIAAKLFKKMLITPAS